METLKDWLARPEIKKWKEGPISSLLSQGLYRDPMRPLYVDPSSFYSPADGFLLYSKVVNPDQPIIDVKGVSYTLQSLLREEVDSPCLVIGIFMTSLDVHVNRIPTNGFITYRKLPPLKVQNLSMREVEREITEQLGLTQYEKLNYVLYNERVVNRIFYNTIKQYYWVVQIADFEVDVIAHFDEQQNKYYSQSERFSVVRLGSQVDLVIPLLNKKVIFQSLVDDKIMHHVEGGVDRLVKLQKAT